VDGWAGRRARRLDPPVSINPLSPPPSPPPLSPPVVSGRAAGRLVQERAGEQTGRQEGGRESGRAGEPAGGLAGRREGGRQCGRVGGPVSGRAGGRAGGPGRVGGRRGMGVTGRHLMETVTPSPGVTWRATARAPRRRPRLYSDVGPVTRRRPGPAAASVASGRRGQPAEELGPASITETVVGRWRRSGGRPEDDPIPAGGRQRRSGSGPAVRFKNLKCRFDAMLICPTP
jgi:hypothetical protein